MSLAKKNQSGVAHILMLLLIVCVIAIAVVVGMRVVNRSSPTTSTTASTASTAIKSTADLTQAQKALDNTQAPDPSQLDGDIKQLL